MEERMDSKAFLFFGLAHYGIEIVKKSGKYLYLDHDYLIEIEGPYLFKLMHQGQVIAPFARVEDLCEFLKQDIQLNYG